MYVCTFASEKFARGQFHPSKVANTSLARLNLTPEIRRYLFRKKFFFLKLGKDQNFFNQVSGTQIFQKTINKLYRYFKEYKRQPLKAPPANPRT